MRMSLMMLAGALALAACDSEEDSTANVDAGGQDATGMTAPDGAVGDAAVADAALPDAMAPDAALPVDTPLCDPLDTHACTLPWPSSVFLEPDDSRATGYTLAFGPKSLPANVGGVGLDPTLWRRMDGYGVGVPIMAQFPNLDITALPSERDLQDSMDADSPAMLFRVEADGLVKVPLWAELDGNNADPATQLLFLRPAEILRENSRHIVVLRGLRTTDDAPIAPSEAFAALRDGATAEDEALAARQGEFDEMFAALEAEGITRDTLTLAWPFHTASSDALHGRMLEMRDRGFEATGPQGPELTVVNIEEFAQVEDPEQPDLAVNAEIWLRIEGTMRVPHYMRELPAENATGWAFNENADGALEQNGWRDATFWVIVPQSARTGEVQGLVQYGHGLFGYGLDVGEVEWSRLCDAPTPRPCGWFNGRVGNQHNFIFFSSDLVGMSDQDRDDTATEMLADLNYFPWLADRLHQGMLEQLLLARAMRERFASLPELQPYYLGVNADELYYSGISQGGIFGATYMALSEDVTRGHLGVPGQNYSTLLSRSIDFTIFFRLIQGFYPDITDQSLILATLQLLWNGTDPVSYYRHITAEPFEGNAPHHVLLAPAKGDYQVAPVTAEITARGDLGIKLMANYDDEREVPLVEPQAYPYTGSGIVNWHFGNGWAPAGNLPPGEDAWGDPHSKARHVDSHNRQMAHFFRTGEIIDVCNGTLCPSDGGDVLRCDGTCPTGLECVQNFCRPEQQ